MESNGESRAGPAGVDHVPRAPRLHAVALRRPSGSGLKSRPQDRLCGPRYSFGARMQAAPHPAADGSLLLLREPIAELRADVRERVADVLERVAHALRVVVLRRARLVAQGRLLAAPDVRAVLDAVVLAAADPRQQLVRAADRHRMRDVEVHQQAREPLDPRALLVVVEALLHEGVEVELVDRLAAGDRHERAA